MPNHFLAIGLCAWDWKRLEELGKGDPSEVDLGTLKDANLCAVADPLPAELESIVASQPRCRYVHKETGEVNQSCNGPPFGERDKWNMVPLTDDESAALVAKYGAADWYGWQRNNWGTKWGTYDTKTHQLGGDGSPILIEFESAWGPPCPQMMRKINEYLRLTYCLTNIKWIGHDPYDGGTHDIEVASDAECERKANA